jgi:hypothetical protein
VILKGGVKTALTLYTGNNLEKTRELFAAAVKHRSRIRLNHPAADAHAATMAGMIGDTTRSMTPE